MLKHDYLFAKSFVMSSLTAMNDNDLFLLRSRVDFLTQYPGEEEGTPAMVSITCPDEQQVLFEELIANSLSSYFPAKASRL